MAVRTNKSVTSCAVGEDGAWRVIDPLGRTLTPEPEFDDTRGASWVMTVRVGDRDRVRIQLSEPEHCAHLFAGYTEAAAHTAARGIGAERYSITERS